MRRVVFLALSVALVAAGGWLLWLEIFEASRIYSKMVLAGGFMLGLGAYLVWEDLFTKAE